jgi:HK97 family phage prohead protease
MSADLIKPPEMPTTERRFTAGRVEIRMEDDGDYKKKTVRGYAAVFNQESENLGTEKQQFREVLSPGAFDDVLGDDVRALFNHVPSAILARSKNGQGTLRIGTDETGLWYEFESPDTSVGRDLMVSLERGDVDQSSFGFEVRRDGEQWEQESRDGITYLKRTISKVHRLHDVSPVTYPAYPDTSVALRSLEQFQKEAAPPAENEIPLTLWERRLEAINLTPVLH